MFRRSLPDSPLSPESAQRRFKAHSRRVLHWSAVLASALIAGAFLIVPPWERPDYRTPQPGPEVVNLEPEIDIPPPPPEVPRPLVPDVVNVSDVADPEISFDTTDFDPLKPPPPPPDWDGVAVPLTAAEVAPVPLQRVKPVYPELARLAGWEGRVWVEIVVDVHGRVVQARVVRSEVVESLELAAVEAARKWLFSPGRHRERPVETRIVIPFAFTLD